MENAGNDSPISFDFLKDENVVKHFADLNIKLLSGKHIQPDDYKVFNLLESFSDEFEMYYKELYQLKLNKDRHDQVTYYYLDFFDTGKGKLSDPSRNKYLTPTQTIVGLTLLNMYYAKYFDNPKIIKWAEVKKEIQEGENREKYQMVFFGEIRPEYTESEWGIVERNWKNTINSFNDFGWVKRTSASSEDLVFTLSPAIHRLVKVYRHEIENFSAFAEQIKSLNAEE